MLSKIALEDAEALIALVATAGEPTVDKPVAARKREIVDGLLNLVDADVWIWTTGTMNPEKSGDAMAVSILDYGWKSQEERRVFLECATDASYGEILFGKLHSALMSEQMLTYSRDQLMDDSEWDKLPVGKRWNAAGMGHFLLSGYPLVDQQYSGLGLHRRLGKPSFTDRDRLVVHILMKNIDWLHRDCGQVPASSKVIALSPRERQVVLLLLGGDTQRQVAIKLQLSEHTVGDHLKVIYRKFGVHSRSELLSQFIANA